MHPEHDDQHRVQMGEVLLIRAPNAAAAPLAGAAVLRISIMDAGEGSAEDPNVSFRFSRPGNLPAR